jgi:hypothetical protein
MDPVTDVMDAALTAACEGLYTFNAEDKKLNQRLYRLLKKVEDDILSKALEGDLPAGSRLPPLVFTGLRLAGSTAKGTGVHGSRDLDVLAFFKLPTGALEVTADPSRASLFYGAD